LRQQRNYGALNQTRQQIDEQQRSPETPAPAQEKRAAPKGPLRTWTHYGGMVPQQESCNKWLRQNHEIRTAANDKPGASREGEGARSPSSDRAQDPSELQEAREIARGARAYEGYRQLRTEMAMANTQQAPQASPEQKQTELNEARKIAQTVRDREAAEQQREQTQERDREGPER
jgi:hypothetical protein